MTRSGNQARGLSQVKEREAEVDDDNGWRRGKVEGGVGAMNAGHARAPSSSDCGEERERVVPVRPVRRRNCRSGSYGMCTPEMARAITRRWISEVPSKIV